VIFDYHVMYSRLRKINVSQPGMCLSSLNQPRLLKARNTAGYAVSRRNVTGKAWLLAMLACDAGSAWLRCRADLKASRPGFACSVATAISGRQG
jgi:hypothetical protein